MVSFASFALLPALRKCNAADPPGAHLAAYVVLVLPSLMLANLLLSWVWLLSRILHEGFRGPRSGDRVATEHRPTRLAPTTRERYIHLNARPSEGQE